MAALNLKPGSILDGRFLLTEVLGQGGMATIFKAQDLDRDRVWVAVKVLLPLFSSGLGAWSVFQREEEIGRGLEHPYVLKYVDLPEDRRRSYIVTEFVPGKSIAARLREERPLGEREAIAIGARVCQALEHVHEQGIVHYDIKPANVMLCDDGTIRLIDFGLAHKAVAKRFTFGAGPPAMGSVDYVAPEQIQRKRGRKSVDIYGLGAMLYEMLTGSAPFPGDDPYVVASTRILGDPPAPRTLNSLISPQAEDVVLRALRRNPAERYPTVAAMRADLEHLDRMQMGGYSQRLQPVTRWRRWLRIARYVGTVGLLPVLVQVLLFFLLWHHLASKHLPGR